MVGAAERLGVARSTAHRLLTMPAYRDFAEQDAAVSIAMPTVRYGRDRLAGWAPDLVAVVDRIERDLPPGAPDARAPQDEPPEA